MNMDYQTIQVEIDSRGVAYLVLNRPEKHNAMNAELIAEVTRAANDLDKNDDVRAVVLTGAGKSFCAGGDLKWMQGLCDATREGRFNDSANIFRMLQALKHLSKPLIGRINGQAFGGGTGMMSVCDITIAVSTGKYALTETRLGLIPANISKFVVEKMGLSNARRTFLNALPLTASDAKEFNLVDKVVEPDDLDAAVEQEIEHLLLCGPKAVADTKKMIFYVNSHSEEDCLTYVGNMLADTWESEEGQEGIRSFFAKDKPNWRG